MPTVFLSHASQDGDAARAVARHLRDVGDPDLTVWLELDALQPGQEWIDALEQALDASTHFLVLVGPSGVKRWVERELRYALVRNTENPEYKLIPLLLGDATEQALPRFLRQYQAPRLPDWRNPDRAIIQQLAAAILAAPAERVNVLAPDEAPFRGLDTFEAEHAHLFFGRDPDVAAVLERLHCGDRFLPIVADSGAGKSSFVRAGLIPALHRGRAGHDEWRIATLKPGDQPLDALAQALPQLLPKASISQSGEAIATGRRFLTPPSGHPGPEALCDALAALALPPGSRQLLFIDQFEELFTQNADPTPFLNLVLRAAQRPHSRLQVVVTFRIDFFALCRRDERIWELLRQHYLLPRLSGARLLDVIRKPAQLAGLAIDPGLAGTMVEEVGDEPGGLALLEHVLDRLWKECPGRPPTFADYDRIGRLKGAVQKHADQVLANQLKSDAERDLARRIFVELTTLGEGRPDSARRVPKSKLEALGPGAVAVVQVLARERLITLGDAPPRADQPAAIAHETLGPGAVAVVQVLAQERLITLGDDPPGADQPAAIAHETLIREWPRMRDWLDKGREDLLLGREIDRDAERWHTQPTGDRLYRGRQLRDARAWRQRTPQPDRPIVDRFLAASGRRQTMTRVAVAATLLALVLLVLLVAGPTLRDRANDARNRLAGVRVNAKHNLPYVFIPNGFSSGFWIGQTEVTQQAFRAVMKSQPPERYPGDDKPMHSVTWFEAQKFCELGGLRLPTEEEWERAARAGTTGEAYGDLDRIAVSGRTDGPAGVKSKDPNNWQLYDMLGNVWEWTASDFDSTSKVLRGGSWYGIPVGVRVSVRAGNGPADRSVYIGFRCAGEFP
ncbi:MAG: SUMF1/EgtB/PvdO family nonheme iron enzyme [Acidobacteriota bacterium]